MLLSYLKLSVAALLPILLSVLFYTLLKRKILTLLLDAVQQILIGVCFGDAPRAKGNTKSPSGAVGAYEDKWKEDQ